MDIPIFFLENIPSEKIIILPEDASRHVVQVLRMKPQETLQLTDGAGTLLIAEIVDDHKKKCTVVVKDVQHFPKKEQQVSIAISLLKNASRFEWFLEKAIEIGVSDIIPLLCDRTEKQHFRFERMKQIVISAMMQSKQVWLPVLHQPCSFSEAINGSVYETKLLAHCEESTKLSIADFRHQNSVQIFIGPEGDFSKEEINTALSKGCKPVSLGATRLRTETAGLVAATVLCV